MITKEQLREHYAKIGKKGGLARKKKASPKQLKEWAAMGAKKREANKRRRARA